MAVTGSGSIRCADDHPRRCVGLSQHGQCHFLAVEGSDRCMRHGGHHAIRKAEQAEVRSYRLSQWRSTIDRFAGADNVKSLREEIGIARMSLESVLKLCKDDFDLLTYSSKISMLLKDIRELVESCYKMEERLGFVLDKSAVINLSEQIINIIQVHVPPDVVEVLADDIADVIVKAGAPLEHDSRSGSC